MIIVVPEDKPVKIPPVETVPTDVLLLDHTPPVAESVSAIVAFPTHSLLDEEVIDGTYNVVL